MENNQNNEAYSVKTEMGIFSEFLKKKGLKVTHQRLLVAEKIFSLHSHFTADGLLDTFRDKRDEISKATIYRIIAIMLEANLLIEHDFGKGFKFYEHIIGHKHHDHILCLSCNRIVEFTNEDIEELQAKEAEKHGFQVKGHSLILQGECTRGDNCPHFLEKRKNR